MHDSFFLLVCVVVLATIFDFINGFHDTANAIATSVSTRVLSPKAAVAMAALLNLIGALSGTAVAKTVGAGNNTRFKGAADFGRENYGGRYIWGP